MSFRTFVPKAGSKRVAAEPLEVVMPQPPADARPRGRKRGRVASPEPSATRTAPRSVAGPPAARPSPKVARSGGSGSGRRLVMKSKHALGPPVPLKPPNQPWTTAENAALSDAVMTYGERKRDWPKVAKLMKPHGRDKDACRRQWLRLRPPVKGSWTDAEDQLLTEVVTRQGATGWSSIAKHIAGRNAKQCRERWVNHLNPNVKKTQWTKEEDELLLKVQKELGNKWSEIAKRLTGRPDNAVKNRWYTLRHRAGEGGPRRKPRRKAAKPPAPKKSLASLLAQCASIDFDSLEPQMKVSFATLASRFSALAGTGDSEAANDVLALQPLLGAAAQVAAARPAASESGVGKRRAGPRGRRVARGAAAASAASAGSTSGGSTTAAGGGAAAGCHAMPPQHTKPSGSTRGGRGVMRGRGRGRPRVVTRPARAAPCTSGATSAGLVTPTSASGVGLGTTASVASAGSLGSVVAGLITGGSVITASQPSLEVSCDSLMSASLASDFAGAGAGDEGDTNGGAGHNGAMVGHGATGSNPVFDSSNSGAASDSFASDLMSALDSLDHMDHVTVAVAAARQATGHTGGDGGNVRALPSPEAAGTGGADHGALGAAGTGGTTPGASGPMTSADVCRPTPPTTGRTHRRTRPWGNGREQVGASGDAGLARGLPKSAPASTGSISFDFDSLAALDPVTMAFQRAQPPTMQAAAMFPTSAESSPLDISGLSLSLNLDGSFFSAVAGGAAVVPFPPSEVKPTTGPTPRQGLPSGLVPVPRSDAEGVPTDVAVVPSRPPAPPPPSGPRQALARRPHSHPAVGSTPAAHTSPRTVRSGFVYPPPGGAVAVAGDGTTRRPAVDVGAPCGSAPAVATAVACSGGDGRCGSRGRAASCASSEHDRDGDDDNEVGSDCDMGAGGDTHMGNTPEAARLMEGLSKVEDRSASARAMRCTQLAIPPVARDAQSGDRDRADSSGTVPVFPPLVQPLVPSAVSTDVDSMYS